MDRFAVAQVKESVALEGPGEMMLICISPDGAELMLTIAAAEPAAQLADHIEAGRHKLGWSRRPDPERVQVEELQRFDVRSTPDGSGVLLLLAGDQGHNMAVRLVPELARQIGSMLLNAAQPQGGPGRPH